MSEKFRYLLFLLLVLPGFSMGQLWQSVGGGTSQVIHDMYTDTIGQKIYLSGSFHYAGGQLVNETCTWNGIEFDTIGPGLGANDLCTVEPCCVVSYIVPQNDKVFAGGRVVWFDGTNASPSNLNWFDGQRWDSCGLRNNFQCVVEANQEVFALAYAINDPTVHSIMRFDGSTWIPFADPFDFGEAGPWDAEYFQGDYYFSGNFSENPPLKEIVRWDGSNWHALGQGIPGNSWVQSMKVYKGQLYVGGQFYYSWGSADDFLMAWDGQQWLPTFPNVQFTSQVMEMEVLDGKLYMIGQHYVYQNGAWQGPYMLGRYDGVDFCSIGGDIDMVFDVAGLDGRVFISTGYIVKGDTLRFLAEYIGGAQDEVCVPQSPPTDVLQARFAGMRVYPNPTSGQFNLQLEGLAPGKLQASVFDLSGKVIREWDLEHQSSGNFQAKLDMTGIQAGTYLLQVRQEGIANTVRVFLTD